MLHQSLSSVTVQSKVKGTWEYHLLISHSSSTRSIPQLPRLQIQWRELHKSVMSFIKQYHRLDIAPTRTYRVPKISTQQRACHNDWLLRWSFKTWIRLANFLGLGQIKWLLLISSLVTFVHSFRLQLPSQTDNRRWERNGIFTISFTWF